MFTGYFSRIYRISQIFFQIVLFQKILTFVPHTSWYRHQSRCYLAGPVVHQGLSQTSTSPLTLLLFTWKIIVSEMCDMGDKVQH